MIDVATFDPGQYVPGSAVGPSEGVQTVIVATRLPDWEYIIPVLAIALMFVLPRR